jgi:predicted anti-sigma-YlaC factor YlaD
MNCQHIRNNLTDYLEGGLNPARQQEVSRHLETCSDCRDFSYGLKGLFDFIEQEKVVEYDPFMFTRIQAAMDKPAAQRQPLFMARMMRPALLVIVLLLMVYTGIRIGRAFSYKSYVNQDYKTELYYLSDIHETNYETALLND